MWWKIVLKKISYVNFKTQIVTKLKIQVVTLNLKCVENQKLELWQNSKTYNVTKPKNLNHGKTQKFKWWLKSKTWIMTKLKNLSSHKTENSNSDKTKETQVLTKLNFGQQAC